MEQKINKNVKFYITGVQQSKIIFTVQDEAICKFITTDSSILT